MKLSVVATLYHSAPYLEQFHQRVSTMARDWTGGDYEIILVNDGSPDHSLTLAVELANQDPHVVVVDLSRNFGHHQAMMTGLAQAKGEHVFLLDSDLEEEPEWLPLFAASMEQDHCDVVYGVLEARRGGWFDRLSGTLYYQLFRFLTGINQPNNIVTARLMTRRYVQALLLHSEREINIGGLWILTGFKQSAQIVHKHNSSPTTYRLSHKISHFVNAITSFSSTPLVMTFYAGLLISLSAMLFILKLAYRYYFISSPPDGYTSIIASIWLFSGLIIFFMGIQGIYISKIFSEVKHRPLTIIRHIYRAGDARGNQS